MQGRQAPGNVRAGPSGWLERARLALGEPVEAASLGLFRVAFGLLLAYEMLTKLRLGRHHELFGNAFHFKYTGFSWVTPPGEIGTYALILGLTALSLCIALGVAYRAVTVLTAVGLWAYFLMERTLYINHIYLYGLLLTLLVFIPADRAFTLRQGLAAWRTRGAPDEPADPRPVVPFWSLAVLRFQMGLVYSYAGIAKLNPDWIAGFPLRIWVPPKAGQALEPLLSSDQLALVMSWGGLAFDLLITPLLLFRRTRLLGAGWAFSFHVMNASLFGIASFPWMSLALTTLFFDPDWPRRFWIWLRPSPGADASGAAPPGPSGRRPGGPPRPMPRPGFTLLCAYALVQLCLPLRPFLYPGNPLWTEQGHEFSWRMMLRHKHGDTRYTLRDPVDGRRWEVRPADTLSARQVQWSSSHPELIRQFSHHLADTHEAQGHPRPEVYVDAWVKLNQHPYYRMIDATVDLGREPHRFGPDSWIVPFGAEPRTASARER
jgi:vitamin K-dependent gamma-carboxylase